MSQLVLGNRHIYVEVGRAQVAKAAVGFGVASDMLIGSTVHAFSGAGLTRRVWVYGRDLVAGVCSVFVAAAGEQGASVVVAFGAAWNGSLGKFLVGGAVRGF